MYFDMFYILRLVFAKMDLWNVIWNNNNNNNNNKDKRLRRSLLWLCRTEWSLTRYAMYQDFLYENTLHTLSKDLLKSTKKLWIKRMASAGMLRRVASVRTDISEELSNSLIRMTRIDELGTMLAVTSYRRTLRRNTKWTRATRRNIPGDAILHSHRSEIFKSYKLLIIRRLFIFQNCDYALQYIWSRDVQDYVYLTNSKPFGKSPMHWSFQLVVVDKTKAFWSTFEACKQIANCSMSCRTSP
jgi:hypothetical protein